MTKDLSKLYDTLSVEERFHLRIRAQARNDRADADRLDRACPSGEYSAYCARLDASEVLTLCSMAALLPNLAQLQMLGAVRPLVAYLEEAATDAGWMEFLDGYAAGWKAAGKRGKPPAVSDETLDRGSTRANRLGTRFSEMLDGIAVALAESARTSRDAVAAFAENDLGVSLSDLLGAWARPAIDTLAQHAEALDAAAPDPDGLALLGELTRVAWRRHGLQDTTAEVPDELRERYEAAQRIADGEQDA